MADRRQKKLETKKKKRDLAKKKARAEQSSRLSFEERMVVNAARGAFGPCAISAGWDDGTAEMPELVTVVVTRELPDGDFLPSVNMVDRTCLGVKDAFVAPPLGREELQEFFDHIFEIYGGWVEAEPLVAQSVVFHAVDYAQRLGFEPSPDARLELLGPRPEQLVPTALHAREKPFYAAGPNDNVRNIVARLEKATGGPEGFDFFTPFTANGLDALVGDDGAEEDDWNDLEEDDEPGVGPS